MVTGGFIMNNKNIAIGVVALVVIVAVAGVAYWMMDDRGNDSVPTDSFVPYEMYSEGTFEYYAPGIINDSHTEYCFADMTVTLNQDSILFNDISKHIIVPENTTPEGWNNYIQEALEREYDTVEWKMPGVGIEEIQDRMIRSYEFLEGWTPVPTSVEYELRMLIDGVAVHDLTGYKFVKGSDAIYVTTDGIVLEVYLYDSSVPGNHLDFLFKGAQRTSEYGPTIYN